MSSRGAMAGRIFAALDEGGPLPREELARRATLEGDVKRAMRIIRDLIEEGELVVAPDGSGALERRPPRSGVEALIRHNRQRRAVP